MAESGQRKAIEASIMATSRCWPPTSPRSRASSAAVMAWAAVQAVTLSQTSVRRSAGTPVAVSVCTAAMPDAAWMTLS